MSLPDFAWHEIIALVIYNSNHTFLKNRDIVKNSIVEEYNSYKKIKSLDGIVSKTLNRHSIEGISNDKQRKKMGHYYFIKNHEGGWGLTHEGKMLAIAIKEKL